MYITNPSEIEKKSFEIIDEIIKSEHKGYEFKSSFEEKIIKRTIVRTDSLINRSYEINSKEDIDKYRRDYF